MTFFPKADHEVAYFDPQGRVTSRKVSDKYIRKDGTLCVQKIVPGK